jgi:gas vesicle protein
MEYIPAISLLVVFLIIFIAVLRKFNGEQLSTIFAGKNFLLLSSFLLFLILVIVHLFQNQTWTADVLKVIVGVFVGVSATFAAESGKGKSEHGVDMGSSKLGDNAKVAGRDINEFIDKVINDIKNVRGDISQVKDSVIKQYPTIQSSLTDIVNESKDSRHSVQRRVMVKIELTNPDLIRRFEKISDRPNFNLMDDVYVDMFVSHGEFIQKLRQKVDEFEQTGWEVNSIRLSDNSNLGGFYFDFNISKSVLGKRVRS